MWVAFDGGIKWLSTAAVLISGASSSIFARMSRTIPAGGAETPGIVGSKEWQGTQRRSITDCTWVNAGAGPDAAADDVLGRSQIASAARALGAVRSVERAS